MSETVLVAGSVIVVVALVAVLAAYLFVIGSAMRHLAETLDEKVRPGAAEVAEHVAAAGPAAGEVLRRLRPLAGTIASLTQGR